MDLFLASDTRLNTHLRLFQIFYFIDIVDKCLSGLIIEFAVRNKLHDALVNSCFRDIVDRLAQLAFYLNLYRTVIAESCRFDIDLSGMLGKLKPYKSIILQLLTQSHQVDSSITVLWTGLLL